MTDPGFINEDSFRIWLRHFQSHRVARSRLLLLDDRASRKNLQALQGMYSKSHNTHTSAIGHVILQGSQVTLC